MTNTVPLQANNRIWLTYRHFPYKSWTAVAELIDNSTQNYFDNRKALDAQLKRDKAPFAVRIESTAKTRSSALSTTHSAWTWTISDRPSNWRLRRMTRQAARSSAWG